MMESREIDLKVLLVKMFLHWRKLLIMIILFAIAGGIFAFLRSGSGPVVDVSELKEEMYDPIIENINIYQNILDEDYYLLTKSNIDTETRNITIEEISLVKDMIAKEKENLSKEECEYVEAIIAGKEAKFPGTVDEVQSVNSLKNIIKYVGIGAFFGIFIFGCIYIVSFIFNSKLNNVVDIENCFDIKLFYIEKNISRKKFIFDKWLYACLDKGKHFYKKDDLVDIVSTNVKLINKINGKVVIAGRYFDDERKEIIDKIIEKSSDNGIKVVYAEDILYDAKSLDMLTDAVYVVLSEKEDVSVYEEVVKEIKLLKELEVKVIGCIV